MASFICPECGNDTLGISLAAELPATGHDDEMTLQTVSCTNCGLQGIAVYRESRHGSLQNESWDHTGYELEGDEIERFSQSIAACPAPQDKRCPCQTHQSLAQRDWITPASDGIRVKRNFQMLLARSN